MKKQFFTTSIAFIAALSLSASAFAADNTTLAPGLSGVPGFSGPGASYSEPATLTKDGVELIAESNGVTAMATVSTKDFKENWTGKVALLNLTEDGSSDEDDDVIETLQKNFSIPNPEDVSVLKVINLAFVAVNEDGSVEKELTPKSPIKVVLNKIEDCNVIYDPGFADNKTGKPFLEVMDEKDAEGNKGNFISFVTTHFSPYYAVNVPTDYLGVIFDNQTGSSEATTTPDGGFQPSGPDGTTANTENTTAAPSNTTGSNNDNTPSGSNTTTTPAGEGSGSDVTNSSDSGNNSGAGNTTGTGSDKNQNTGVVLAVVPVAAAAAAVIISKKRK